MKSLISAQTERVESALWAGLRNLEESEALARRLADAARHRGHDRSARQYDERASEDARHADVLGQMFHTMPHEVPEYTAAVGHLDEAAAGSAGATEGSSSE